jgi:hypothetical protein
MSEVFSPSKKKCRRSQSRKRSTGRCRKKPCSKSKTRDVVTRQCRKKKCSRGKTRDVSSRRCRKKKSLVRKSPSKASRSRKKIVRKSPSKKSVKKRCPSGKIRNRSNGLCQRSKTRNYAAKSSIDDQIRNWNYTGKMFPTKSGFIPPPANKLKKQLAEHIERMKYANVIKY